MRSYTRERDQLNSSAPCTLFIPANRLNRTCTRPNTYFRKRLPLSLSNSLLAFSTNSRMMKELGDEFETQPPPQPRSQGLFPARQKALGTRLPPTPVPCDVTTHHTGTIYRPFPVRYRCPGSAATASFCFVSTPVACLCELFERSWLQHFACLSHSPGAFPRWVLTSWTAARGRCEKAAEKTPFDQYDATLFTLFFV